MAGGKLAEYGTYIGRVFAALKKYLLVPRLIRLASAAPKDPVVAWDQYWGKVRATGAEGDVLWDSGSDHELSGYLPKLARLDPELPVVDVGCGNGSFTRLLAMQFPHALGVDYSANAVARARQESAGNAKTSFAECDVTAPGAARIVRSALEVAGFGAAGAEGAGMAREANVFIRGVLHVLDRPGQAALASNVLSMVGRRGRVFLAETDFPGNPVDYVTHLGATLRSIPGPLEDAIRGLPMPGRFGAAQRERAFPASDWEVLEDGRATIETRPLTNPSRSELIPGYFAVLKAR